MVKKKKNEAQSDTVPQNNAKILEQEKQSEKEHQLIAAQFQGPLPPPELLSQYNDIEPGLADRIVAMAEKESMHRRKMEEKTLTAEIEAHNKTMIERRLGQIFGFLIGVITIGCGTYAATSGAQWPGGLIGTGGVIGLVTVFVVGNKKADAAKELPRETSPGSKTK